MKIHVRHLIGRRLRLKEVPPLAKETMTLDDLTAEFKKRQDLWAEIQDNPRKRKAGERAARILATAGDVTKMDLASLTSMKVELMEGVAAYQSLADMGPLERESLQKPIAEKLDQVIQLLALREPAK